MPDEKKVNDLLSTFDPRNRTVLEIVDDATNAGVKTLNINIERKLPVRCETPPKAHRFMTMEGFKDFLAAYGEVGIDGGGTTILCNPNTGVFRATIDEDALEGVEQITFEPQVHPAFAEFEMILGKQLDFPALAAFVQRQRRCIVDGPNIARLLRQIKASTKVELLNGAGKDAVNGIVYTTKIAGIEKGSDAELPEVLAIDVPLYIDSPITHLELDLNLETRDEGKKIVAVLSAPTLAVDKFKALQVYAEALKDFQFGFGVPQYDNWRYHPGA